jgi:hypothetical protein
LKEQGKRMMPPHSLGLCPARRVEQALQGRGAAIS